MLIDGQPNALKKDISIITFFIVIGMGLSSTQIIKMFYSCTSFDGDISAWNTAAVTDMSGVCIYLLIFLALAWQDCCCQFQTKDF